MELTQQYLSELFWNIVSENKDYNLALNITRQNTRGGKVWLIGGFLYKTLVSQLYGTQMPAKDFDFIVEFPAARIRFPDGWIKTKNRFKNLKFSQIETDLQIDFVPLNKVFSIMHMGQPPTIENYLKGTPLNIHSLAYNTKENFLIGDVGIYSIKNKLVKVYNLEMAKEASKIYGISVEDMVRDKARELNFGYKL